MRVSKFGMPDCITSDRGPQQCGPSFVPGWASLIVSQQASTHKAASPKEDTNISSAKLCFVAALILPGEFITVPNLSPQDFVDSLRAAPPPPSTRPKSYAQVPAAPPASLFQAKFDYIRCGGTVPSLQPRYMEPYRVVSSGDKCFTVEIRGKTEVVSID
jgi:hypothetical protein